jgi:membrane-associated phospholipid phosphatase
MTLFSPRLKLLLVLLCISFVSAAEATGQTDTTTKPDYLDAGALAAIGGVSVTAWLVGIRVNDIDSTTHSLWSGPLPGETWLQRKLGGRYYPGKTNFLDSDFGSALTPLIGLFAVSTANLAWPRGDEGQDIVQDAYLYMMGLAATKGVTSMTKGIVARPRPVIALKPGLAAQREEIDHTDDRHAFFSGHASSAFFSMTYANKRVRSIMRYEMTPDAYRSWRWLPSALSYGWAAFVAWSRIEVYKHYLSDVVVGALVGWGLGELFYEFGDDTYEDLSPAAGTPLFLQVQLPI